MTTTEERVEEKVRPSLPDFEGLPVLTAAIKIPNVGGGLRDALKVDPVAHEIGDEFLLVMRCRVRKVDFNPIDKDNPDVLSREHVADATDVAIVSTNDDLIYVSAILDRTTATVAQKLLEMDAEGTLNDPEHGAAAAIEATGEAGDLDELLDTDDDELRDDLRDKGIQVD